MSAAVMYPVWVTDGAAFATRFQALKFVAEHLSQELLQKIRSIGLSDALRLQGLLLRVNGQGLMQLPPTEERLEQLLKTPGLFLDTQTPSEFSEKFIQFSTPSGRHVSVEAYVVLPEPDHSPPQQVWLLQQNGNTFDACGTWQQAFQFIMKEVIDLIVDEREESRCSSETSLPRPRLPVTRTELEQVLQHPLRAYNKLATTYHDGQIFHFQPGAGITDFVTHQGVRWTIVPTAVR